jgi:hypothetical protein
VTDGGRLAVVPINRDAASGRPSYSALVFRLSRQKTRSPDFTFRDSSPVILVPENAAALKEPLACSRVPSAKRHLLLQRVSEPTGRAEHFPLSLRRRKSNAAPLQRPLRSRNPKSRRNDRFDDGLCVQCSLCGRFTQTTGENSSTRCSNFGSLS